MIRTIARCRTVALAVSTLSLGGCLDLDSFVHNPVHCSTVDAATCDESVDPWDRVCTPCADPYDWAAEHPWFSQTLRGGATIRAIDAARVEAVPISTDDGAGELDAYFIPSHGEVPALASTTVLYSHGNYAGIEHYLPRIRMLHEIGFNVLAWDYRGYGKSQPETTPSVDEFFADARQVRDLVDQVAPDPERVVLYANSLGGLPTVEMGLYRPGCAMLLEAPFTSLRRIAESNSSLSLGESFLSAGRFDNVAKIAAYEGPLMVMIGDQDVKFPVADVRAMFDAAASPEKELWILPGVNHGIANVGVPEAGFAEYATRIRRFLGEHAPACVTSP